MVHGWQIGVMFRSLITWHTGFKLMFYDTDARKLGDWGGKCIKNLATGNSLRQHENRNRFKYSDSNTQNSGTSITLIKRKAFRGMLACPSCQCHQVYAIMLMPLCLCMMLFYQSYKLMVLPIPGRKPF